MTSLAALTGGLVTILQLHQVCVRVTVIETKEFSADQYTFKIKAEFVKNTQFQARIYYNRGHIDYAYQFFSSQPLLRWDNKEEFAHLSTYPHHFHDPDGGVHASSLAGDPIIDIQQVLQVIFLYMEKLE